MRFFMPGSYLCFFFQNLYNFLAQPNVLEQLDISSTDTALESVRGRLSPLNELMFDKKFHF